MVYYAITKYEGAQKVCAQVTRRVDTDNRPISKLLAFMKFILIFVLWQCHICKIVI
jgi:hypothetical protein